MPDELKEKIRQAGKVQADPALTAIQELSESVAVNFEALEDAGKKTEETVKASVSEVRTELDKTRTEMAAGFKVQGDKLNTLERRSLAITGPRDMEGIFLAAMDEKDRETISILDWQIPRGKRNEASHPILSNPIGASLVSNWLHKSLLIQRRRFASKQHETELYASMEKYEKALAEAFPEIQKAAALITTTDTLGGHWLPDPVAVELYRLILDNSVVGGLATHVPMTTKTLDLPIEGSSALAVSWGTENTAITDSVPASNAINKVTLTASRLNGRAQSSLEEIQDSPVSILNWIQSKLVEMCGREIDSQALEGTGSPFTGLSNDASVNAETPSTNGDALTYAMLVSLVFKARERASRTGARFFMAPEIMAKTVGLVDTQGMPIVQFSNVPGAVPGTILGYPVEVHSVIKADRTWGTGTALSNIYFGPPSQIVIGDRMGMSWDVSDQPNFTSATVDMRLITRLAIGIAVPKAFSRRPRVATA